MAGSTVQLFQNDQRVKVAWASDRSGSYISWNLYWSTDSNMAGEAIIASSISNVPDGRYSKNDIIYEFNRSALGVSITSEFYVRVKGVSSLGVEDAAHPGPTKYIPFVEPDREEYHASQGYGYDYNKDIWRRIRVEDDGSLAVAGLTGFSGGSSYTGPNESVIKDWDSDLKADVETVGDKNALDVNLIGVAGLTGLDIQIGAMEIKDATTDLRASIEDIGGETGTGALDVFMEGARRDVFNFHNAATLTGAYVYSSSVDCKLYGQAIVLVEYLKGTEASFEFKFQFSHDNATWFDANYETLGAPTITSIKEYQFMATGNERIVVQLNDMYMRMGIKATTPGVGAGTVSANVVLGWA